MPRNLAVAAVVALAGLGLPAPAVAADPELAACAATGAALETIDRKYPDLSESGPKPRLALVFIGTAAATGLAYAGDAGWSDDRKAPLEALLALRDGPADGTEPPARDEMPGLVARYTLDALDMLARTCPDIDPPELTAIPAPGGDPT